MATYFYVSDEDNDRIKKHVVSNVTHDSNFGSSGSGDDDFDAPAGICADDTYLYICDASNHRIKKHLLSDKSYDSQIGSNGTGNDEFDYPYGICTDGTYLYISDLNNHRIKKHRCSDLSYVSEVGGQGSGNNQFDIPEGLCTDGTYFYVADNNNHRIKKHLCSDMAYDSDLGSDGSGDNQFSFPVDVCTDNTYLYISDYGNNRVKKHACSDLSYDSKVTIQSPGGMCTTGGYLFVFDNTNRDIEKRSTSDLSLVSQYESTHGTGITQFKDVWGMGVSNFVTVTEDLSITLPMGSPDLLELEGEAFHQSLGIDVGHHMKVWENKLNPDWYGYYLADTNGKVYVYSSDYQSDNGTAITSTYVTKVLDFSDQLKQYNDKFKTVFCVKVYYKDLSEDTSITVYLSNDAGSTFESSSKTVGTGDGTIKNKLFHFIKTGQYFQVKIEESSTNNQFCIVGAELMVYPRGEWMSL